MTHSHYAVGMPSHKCYSCNVTAQQILYGEPIDLVSESGKFGSMEAWTAPFRCANCSVLNIGTVKFYPEHAGDTDRAQAMTKMKAFDSVLDWLPHRIEGREYEHVPAHIALAADEAYRCRSVNAFKATAILARAVVEATAKDKDITVSGIASKIDALHDKKLIGDLARDEAHEIRFLGNDMAHGDFVTPVTAQEASDVLELMDAILDEVYEQRGRLERIRKHRIEKKAAVKTAQQPHLQQEGTE